jgi:hypothetical protein
MPAKGLVLFMPAEVISAVILLLVITEVTVKLIQKVRRGISKG